jgi:hypothetical protein
LLSNSFAKLVSIEKESRLGICEEFWEEVEVEVEVEEEGITPASAAWDKAVRQACRFAV